MPTSSRRQFLNEIGLSTAAVAAGPWLRGLGSAQTPRAAGRAVLSRTRIKSELDRRLFGAFLEHLGRAVYTGVYDPGNPARRRARLPQGRASRKSKDLHVPIMRYPGGNFVSGYNWLDGVGPKKDRPTVLERAWNSLETNQFGTNEFMDWAKAVGTEPLLGFNLGTGTSEMAVAYIEYCNYRQGHQVERPAPLAWLRTAAQGEVLVPRQRDGRPVADGPTHGARIRPQGARHRAAGRASSIPDVQLIACGSSNTILPTYLAWDREVLEECYDQVDGISLHNYFGNEPELDRQQVRALPGAEPRHGAADPGDHRGRRLRAGPAPLAEAAVAVVRRMERLVSRARPAHLDGKGSSRRSCSRRSTTSRTRCSPAASSTR